VQDTGCKLEAVKLVKESGFVFYTLATTPKVSYTRRLYLSLVGQATLDVISAVIVSPSIFPKSLVIRHASHLIVQRVGFDRLRVLRMQCARGSRLNSLRDQVHDFAQAGRLRRKDLTAPCLVLRPSHLPLIASTSLQFQTSSKLTR
jgi:hypothetical protein